MKTCKQNFTIMAIAVITVITLSTCFSDWKGDEGTFSISIGGSGSGRVLLPWADDINSDNLVHVITLEGPGPKQDKTVLPGVGAKTVSFSVVPGLWNITIEAYEVSREGDEERRVLVAVGYRTVDIKPGSNSAITIQMGFMEMVWVAGGTFQLGADNLNEEPVSNVTLTGFYIGKYEVTQAQWQAVMGTNPSSFTSNADEGEVQEKRPVENVTWYDAIEFCNKLSSLEGLEPVYTITNRTPASGYPITSATVTTNWSNSGYRLPTEAQWEYAARGGNGSPGNYTYAGSNAPDEVAWYINNSGNKTHEVGKKTPNGLGLYDMSGNVWERCWDWYGNYTSADKTDPTGPESPDPKGSYRVGRGGGFRKSVVDSWEVEVRSVYRHNFISSSYRDNDLGFRVARPW